MKKLSITSLSLFIFICGYSQTEKIEKEIRQIEEKRVTALLKKDTTALQKIWASEYSANRPAGFVSTREKVLELILTDTLNLSSYKFEMEHIIIKQNFVITMGNENVKPGGNNPNSGKTLHRRYTHVWFKENGNWRLTARHANILCQ